MRGSVIWFALAAAWGHSPQGSTRGVATHDAMRSTPSSDDIVASTEYSCSTVTTPSARA